jgi:ABC-2 type transport system permease protein
VRAAILISLKDLRERARDRSVLLYALVAPLGLALIFSSIFGGAFGVELDLDYAVVDLDGGPVAAAFTDGVVPAVEADGLATFERSGDLADIRERVGAGDLTAAFILPEGLSAAVTSGAPATVEVIGNVDAGIGTDVAEAIAASFATELTATQVAVVAAGAGADPEAAASIAAAVAAEASPIGIGEVTTRTAQLDGVTYLSAGMAVFFLFFTVQFGVLSLLEERRVGTLQRLLAAPLPRAAVIGGKLLASFVLGVVALVVLIVASDVLIGAEWGHPLGVAMLVVAGVLAAVAVMAVIATLARTVEQANTWQSIVAVILGALGGVFFPIAGDGLLASVASLTPHQWFLRGLGRLAGGGPVDVLPAVGALLAFAAVGFALAATRLRGEML